MARRFTVQVRVSEEERAELRRRAGESSVSDYLRMVGLGGVVVKGRGGEARSFSPVSVEKELAGSGASVEVARVSKAPPSAAPSERFRCPLPACRHQQKRAGKCPRHGHGLVPVRL